MNAHTSSRPESGGRRKRGPQGTDFVAHEDLPASAAAHDTDGADGAPALVGLTPPFADQRFPLHSSESRIGRDADNTIVIDDPGISSQHARINYDRGRWTVLNVLSTNGTYVNGRAVHEAEIHDGDRIALGNIAFEFRLHEPESMSASADGWQRPGVIVTGVLLLAVAVIGAILLL